MNQPFDTAKSDAFSQSMFEIINHGGLALMISVGHRVGLFDAMANLPPMNSADIAQSTGLNERYIREWLGAMVTGGVVEYDLGSGTFKLPAEHAAWLTRAASPNNLAVSTQWMAVLAGVE